MRIFIRPLFIGVILASGWAFAQPSLILKTRQINKRTSTPLTELRSPLGRNREHLLLQLDPAPSAETVGELRLRGVNVLQDVPENGLLVSVGHRVDVQGLGVVYAAPIAPADKISPLITAPGYFLVEFHPDADMNQARGLLLDSGVELHENPDLNPHHLMIQTNDPGVLAKVSAIDDVGYIFPASGELTAGLPTAACIGALTTNGTTSQSIPTYGDGWDGPGLGAAILGYVYSHVTAQLPAAAAQAEIQRAMAEWSKAVQVTWTPGTSSTAPRTVNIIFATGDHGDGFPFGGPGGILAHTFYPASPNPEPIAGDMHFNDADTWRIGSNTDLFSVALHELGHALGLGHSDNPSAVMYPYYQMVSGLSALDIATVQTLYAAQSSPSPAPPAAPAPIAPAPAPPAYVPMTLIVNAVGATTSASAIALSGSVTGGSGPIVVTWATSSSSGTAQSSGPAWTAASVPLTIAGVNTITITASDSRTHITQSIAVTRQSTATPSGTDTTPPSLSIASPSSSTISTSASSMAFSGTASDNVGVTSVTWSTNTGGSGVASGTTQWNATIPLLVGSNTVLVRASDAAGNIGWRTAVVTRF